MGNCVSAFPGDVTPKIRVLQASEGLLVDVEVPALQSSMKVGELMLEFAPGHFLAQLDKADFLANSTSSKRAVPLGADADAKPGTVYVLFPMLRLHTRISPQELLSLAQLLHLHDQQLCKAAPNPSKARGRHAGLFTAGARVAPLPEQQYRDAHLEMAAHDDQAGSLRPSSCIKQSEPELSSAYPPSSFLISSCHGRHIGAIKPKPWTPALQTIMESSS